MSQSAQVMLVVGESNMRKEFSGTLLGFDDYVSEYPFYVRPRLKHRSLITF